MKVDEFLSEVADSSRLKILLSEFTASSKTLNDVVIWIGLSELVEEKLGSVPAWKTDITYAKVLKDLHVALSEARVIKSLTLPQEVVGANLLSLKQLANSYNNRYNRHLRKVSATQSAPSTQTPTPPTQIPSANSTLVEIPESRSGGSATSQVESLLKSIKQLELALAGRDAELQYYKSALAIATFKKS